MRIVRYPLEIVDYQQLQPLWPGRVLSVAPGRMRPPAPGGFYDPDAQKIDLWCIDDNTNRGPYPPPVLGVWIVGTGHPMPDGLLDGGYGVYHGTCVMDNGLVWHVFTTDEGTAPETEAPFGEVSSVDELVEKIKAKHAHRRQP